MKPTASRPDAARAPLTDLPASPETWEVGAFDIAELMEPAPAQPSGATFTAIAERETGAGLGVHILEDPEPWDAVADLVIRACHEPDTGSPRLPAVLVAERAELAPALRDRFRGTAVRVVVEEGLPAAESLALDYLEEILGPGAPRGGYTDEGVPAATARELFDAASTYFRCRLGQVLGRSELFEFGLPGRAEPLYAAVIAGGGPARGVVLYDDRESLAAFLAEPAESEETNRPTLSLTFQPRADAPEDLVEEARREGWKLASEKAFPIALRTGPAEEPVGSPEIRYVNREEAELLVLAARALAAFCTRHRRRLRRGDVAEGAEAVRSASGESIVVRVRMLEPDELPDVSSGTPELRPADPDPRAAPAAAAAGCAQDLERVRALTDRVPGSRSIIRRLQWTFFRAEFPLYAEDEVEAERALFRFLEWVVFAAPTPDDGRTLAQRGIDEAPGLSEPERRRLRAVADPHYGVFEVETVEPGTGLVISDLATRDRFEVRDRLAPHEIDAGDILLGAIFPDGAGRYLLSAAIISYPGPPPDELARAPELLPSGADFAIALEDEVFGATIDWIQELETPRELRKSYEEFARAMGGKAAGIPTLAALQQRVRQADSLIEVLGLAHDIDWWRVEEAKLFVGFLQRLWNMTPRPELGDIPPDQAHRGEPPRPRRGGGGKRSAGKSKKRRRR